MRLPDFWLDKQLQQVATTVRRYKLWRLQLHNLQFCQLETEVNLKNLTYTSFGLRIRNMHAKNHKNLPRCKTVTARKTKFWTLQLKQNLALLSQLSFKKGNKISDIKNSVTTYTKHMYINRYSYFFNNLDFNKSYLPNLGLHYPIQKKIYFFSNIIYFWHDSWNNRHIL